MRWVHTSDIHGAEMCLELKLRLGADVLSDGGDCLQGSAWTCYANEVAVDGMHLVAKEMNTMGYDVGVIGNHDIEAGREVMGRWVRGCEFPVLGANVRMDGVVPYVVIEREGKRIAVMGLVTVAVKRWVAEEKWKELEIMDVVESAREWMKVIRETETVDAVVGILHSGWDGGMEGENVARRVAEEVDGFDLVLYGHDHHAALHGVGDVWCVGVGGDMVGVVELGVVSGELKVERVELVNVGGMVAERREDRCVEFGEWLNVPVCEMKECIDEREAYFGPSAFIGLFHEMQRWATGAEVSLASPVGFDTYLGAGEMTVRDLFVLYRFNTEVCTLSLSGREILGVLERSYGLWTNRMESAEDEALLMDYILDGGRRKGLKYLSLNMLSAAGIMYEVDLTKDVGERVRIKGMEDGRVFDLNKRYTVAVNSYHASGGGEMLTLGGGIGAEELRERVVCVCDSDSRGKLWEYLKAKGTYVPKVDESWHFVPVEWTEKALKRDRCIIFP